MKLISEHLGRLIVALACIGLLITTIVFFRAPVSDFFDAIINTELKVGNTMIDGFDPGDLVFTESDLNKTPDDTSSGGTPGGNGGGDDTSSGGGSDNTSSEDGGGSGGGNTSSGDGGGGHVHSYSTYTELSENEHLCYCECGYAEPEPHEFGADTVCDKCGYDDSLRHVHSYSTYTELSENEHLCYCECGYVESEPHEFGADTICDKCGYDNYHHHVNEDDDVYCDICGAQLGEGDAPDMPHHCLDYAGTNGLCAICGQKPEGFDTCMDIDGDGYCDADWCRAPVDHVSSEIPPHACYDKNENGGYIGGDGFCDVCGEPV